MKETKDTKPLSHFAREEEVLRFWRERRIFARTLEKTKSARPYSFYDGPPFITGTPHYGTLVPSIAKDVIPRYQTMRGRFVRRRWGWDVHGLPAENEVEKKLGLKTKRDIERLGVAKFIDACRSYVAEVSDAWRWYIEHVGRWVDMNNAYRTNQRDFMESVIWAFKRLYDKGLIYQGRRTSLYCTRCATPLSKFEVTMDDDAYRPVEDVAVTVKFRLTDDEAYLLAWTTTPWTLPANFALAIDPAAEYVRVTDGKDHYVLAHQALERYRDFDLEIVDTFKGKHLLGERYEPLFDFFGGGDKDHKIYPADFVNLDEGTGIVHIAPGFGEEDSALGEKVGLSLFESVDEEGRFVAQVKPWAGQFYRQANSGITDDLKKRGLLLKSERIVHSYPHCHRCKTPLIYRSQVSWFLKIAPLREKLKKLASQINWMPPHFGPGRFNHNLETAPDWSLSRTRYWGTPLPVWQTKDGKETVVVGSIAELEKLSGQKITDLHRPQIDAVEIITQSGQRAYRVPEVLDCWFESGAMPYGQDHFPFENEREFKRHFPADFIVEYTGQLRGWFYYLHVLSSALFQSLAFKNAIVHGVLWGNDGRKMSKSYGNYPDPRATIERYGGEALRLYFMGSKIMLGEDLSINEADIREQSRLLNILHNSLQYLVTYAKLHGYDLKQGSKRQKGSSPNIIDRWILLRLEEFVFKHSRALDELDLPAAIREIRPFVEDLSTWYIRRSRERFVGGDQAALKTLRDVFHKFARAVAPTLPFSAENIYQLLRLEDEPESVHLCDYPSSDEIKVSEHEDVLELMDQVREIASEAHRQRAEKGINLRQPLATLTLKGFGDLSISEPFLNILAEEVNVGQIVFVKQLGSSDRVDLTGGSLALDTKVTPELEEAGRLRELIRKLQESRKSAGLEVGEKAALRYATDELALKNLIEKYRQEIMAAASLESVTQADGETTEGFTLSDSRLTVWLDKV